MTTILDEIVATKRQELAERQARVPPAELTRRLPAAAPVRDFHAALASAPGIGIIAEVKKASPSAGVLRADFDPVAIARTYAAAGADCLSVLTDAPYFQGALAYLTAIRAAVAPPVLRKDFLLDAYQVLEARVAGADAVLLIAEILDDALLRRLLRETEGLGMQALVELYEPTNVERVLDSGATLIGINNRDLRTFETRLEHTLELAPRFPPGCTLVSESGIKTRADIERLRVAGVRAVLIGETLMRSGDAGLTLRELRG
ncbi:MAG: indole-3-glycerol phosphate synthase TrpC [Gemmataceae bacterium]|nr:indole-3-glycerol phosphate synthase TrpC [Gemmataceae bacterium]